MSRRLSMQIRILSPYKPSLLNRPAASDPTTKKIGLPDKRVVYTVLRSPHIDKKSREQFELKIRKELLVVNAETPEELRKKFFWLKRHRMYGAQFEVKISCQTHLPYQPSFTRQFSSVSGSFAPGKKRVEDVLPIATGHEKEELEAELEGRNLLDINFPVGPFGTKDAPAVVKSYYSRRLVGCPGGEGEDEHDVVWFWLQKGWPCECPVCSQYFKLEVVGSGGPPDGYGDESDEMLI